MKSKILILITTFLLLVSIVSATPGDPTKFLDENLTASAWIGGNAGIVNATGDIYGNQSYVPSNASLIIAEPWIEESEEGNLNVNGSDYWDEMGSPNSTMFENSGGYLNAIRSWWDGLYLGLTDQRYNETTLAKSINTTLSGLINANNETWKNSNLTQAHLIAQNLLANTTWDNSNQTQAGLINARLPLAGGTMTGDIAMDGNSLLGARNISTANLTVSHHIFVGNVDPFIDDGVVAAEGGFTSHGGYFGQNKGWAPLIRITDSNYSATIKRVTTSTGNFTDATNIFCDGTAKNFSESDVIRPHNWITILTGDHVQAMARIHTYINASCVELNENPGWDVDFTEVQWKKVQAPSIYFGDEGLTRIWVGEDPESKFKIAIPNGTGPRGVYIRDTAGADHHQALSIVNDVKTYDGTVGLNIYSYSSTGVDGVHYDILNLLADTTGITNSEIHFMDVSLIGNANDVDLIHISGDIDHIIHQGSEDTLASAYYNGVNVTYNFTSESSDIPIFEADNDYIYLGNSLNFTHIAVSLATPSSADIYTEYYYCNSTSGWETLASVTDTTTGFTTSGSITLINPDNRGTCNAEYDGTPFSDTANYTYIALKRTRNNVVTKPIENLISIGGGETYFLLQKDMIKLYGSVGGPETCSATYAGAIYYDSSGVELLWCDGTSWQAFAMAGDVTVHNSLSGLQGGTATEYYHLTQAEYETNMPQWDTAYANLVANQSGWDATEANVLANQSVWATGTTTTTLPATNITAGTFPTGNYTFTDGNVTLGITDGDSCLFFFQNVPTEESICWDYSQNKFSISDALNVVEGITTSSLAAEQDIWTTGSGDDFWLGTGTQANANFRAYATGDLVATKINSTTLNTGQGANELYDMDQNVLKSSNPTFGNGTFETLNLIGSGGASPVITITNSTTSTYGLYINNKQASAGFLVVQGGAQPAIAIDQNANANALYIDNAGTGDAIALAGSGNNNITGVNCVVFDSGGRICSGT